MAPNTLAKAGLEPAWAKLLAVPWLVVTSIITTLLLWSDRTSWTSAGQLYQLVVNNRAAVQILIQVLATGFGAIHVYTVCVLINFATRRGLAAKPYTLDRLRFWRAVSAKALDWSMPVPLLALLLVFQVLVAVPAAIWAGALAPVATSATYPSSLPLPQYSAASRDYWADLDFTKRMLSKWIGSMFTYSPNFDLQGLLLNDAASATSVGPSYRIHRKLDNSGYSYARRSFGIAASVGLIDRTINSTELLGYRFNETGYLADVKCIVNATSEWSISEAQYTPPSNTYPNLYLASGTLANGNPEIYAACGLGSSDEIFALVGSTGHGRNSYAIAGGANYAAFDKVMCDVSFTPAIFSVNVNATDRLINMTYGAADGLSV